MVCDFFFHPLVRKMVERQRPHSSTSVPLSCFSTSFFVAAASFPSPLSFTFFFCVVPFFVCVFYCGTKSSELYGKEESGKRREKKRKRPGGQGRGGRKGKRNGREIEDA